MGEDFWRDTWVRYFGYANEVGESFRPIVPNNVVRASYAVSMAYSLADTADKAHKKSQRDGRPSTVLAEAGDALIWQTLASLAIPGFVINRICAFTRFNLGKYSRLSCGVINWVAVGIGLMSIPIIVHPIDDGTTWFMDQTYRKWIK